VKILGTYGYEVLAASTTQEAERIFRKKSGEIDLLVSDIMLPDGMGNLLAEKLRELKSDLRIILMSGYFDPGAFNRLALSVPFLQKPFRPRELVTVVEETLI
jgi:DNA-binding response OmpR family regulator